MIIHVKMTRICENQNEGKMVVIFMSEYIFYS